ncbi:MAG: hypothetical protein IT204_10880 [Fimbriimonadaceae bacterium]|nr:hypothetical protein [Fimbriimonadaceae bacterium]
MRWVMPIPNPARRQRQPVWRERLRQHPALVLLACGLLLAVYGALGKEPSQSRKGRPIAASEVIALHFPELRPGRVTRRDQSSVTRWLQEHPVERHLHGQVNLPGELHLRPWVYTTRWIAEPVVRVKGDRTFDAVAFIDNQYDGPLVLRLEVEDRAQRKIVASQDYFLKGRP